MYLHIGQDTVIRQADIIGVFDLENTTVSRLTRGTLQKAEKAGRVTAVSDDLPRSFVVCSPRRRVRETRDGEAVYICQIAPRTLRKRAK